MTHTIEISDRLHDYITIELENVIVDSESTTYESHGNHDVTEYAISYDILSSISSFGEDVKLTKEMIHEMESKLVELEGAYC